jgi:hypothetical protein
MMTELKDSLPVPNAVTVDGESRRWYLNPWAAFWAGLIVRLLYITVAHTYRFRLLLDHFQFGWEMGRVARALVTGYGYADPFAGHTGPTAWVPPLYPFLMAGVFKVFGVYTAASGWVILAINSVFSAAIAPAVYEIADRCYGDREDGQGVAIWSCWLWALYPAAMQYAVRWPWDMSVTAFLFAWALVVGLRLRGIGGRTSRPILLWALFGLLWGLIALSNSSLLLFLPFHGVWIAWPALRQDWRTLRGPALATVLFLGCLTPWVWRNTVVFHAFVPMRTNFGAELYMSALPSNEGFPWMATLPIAKDAPELRKYARMGELAYCRAQGVEAKRMIAANPGLFLRHIVQRIDFFWVSVPHSLDKGLADEVIREANFAFLSLGGLFGLALSLKRKVPAAGIFGMAFLVMPLIYYVVTVQARFRHPLEPLITIFIVYLFRNADRTRAWSVL